VFFEVIEPSANETPVVVEIPHASVVVDPTSLAMMTVPARCIGQDADLFVDELYEDAPSLGATCLVAKISRYVCDLNRSEADVDSYSVAGGGAASKLAPQGLIWRKSLSADRAIEHPITDSEFQRRLTQIYRPYHAMLQQLLGRKVERFGYAILLAGHSMPSLGRSGHHDNGVARVDVVPGSRGRTTASAPIVDCPDRLARKRGWSVAHDQPYRGGFTTAHYGLPERRVHAIQVELSRRLYMDERDLTRLPGRFEATREYCNELVAELGSLNPESLHSAG
jgi:N-formylglutamate amidohydrolase